MFIKKYNRTNGPLSVVLVFVMTGADRVRHALLTRRNTTTIFNDQRPEVNASLRSIVRIFSRPVF
ncbi:hypothetical protein T4D_5398 [Trichinella pseudospiralis]|uniref:Uncharacterized protein n=1 Tax=Trichinella pseudospiralis TaxID=6337 RepID=A0A0V1FWH7_TRIPS|nr:hypothetical protein T4D_5398 [Trichinella pseudospiralis]